MKRKYTNVTVLHSIYCSSSFDHFIGVTYHENGMWRSRDFYIEGCALMGKRSYDLEIPQYFEDEILRGLLAALKQGVTVYEYDRDGNKRYENLRYHDDEWVQRRIESIERYFEPPLPELIT